MRTVTRQPIPFLLNQPETATTTVQSPLKSRGTTYTMAQSVRWLDKDRFAIGRWDGTLTIYEMRSSNDFTPVVTGALFAPSQAGIEMIGRIKDGIFASSNDAESIEVWKIGDDREVTPLWTLRYDPQIGVANDGTAFILDGTTWFSTGHANGYLLIWRWNPTDGKPVLVHTLDLHSPAPISSPFPLKNIRGVERWQPGFVVTASEDGDLCLIDVVKGTLVWRKRYNSTALRGINDIDTLGTYLVLANCSVGPDDKNLWLYRITSAGFDLLDSINLKVDTTLPQVFNFCVDQATIDGRHFFFAATQEGVIWFGTVKGDRLNIIGNEKVSTGMGAAMAYEPASRLLAVAGDNIHLFEID